MKTSVGSTNPPLWYWSQANKANLLKSNLFPDPRYKWVCRLGPTLVSFVLFVCFFLDYQFRPLSFPLKSIMPEGLVKTIGKILILMEGIH